MATLVIGDIHGCYAELQDLLDKAGLGAEDAIYAIGDIVDRGPATPEVLAFFQNQPNAFSIMGNHERKHVRSLRGQVKLSISQKIARVQIGPQTYPEAVAWMERLPYFHELPEVILAHAYIEPGVPLAEQRPEVLAGTMSGEKHLLKTYPQPWYELYAGDKPVITGHRDYQKNGEPFIYNDRVYGLDTGCATGGRLTGLLLPAFQILSVPSRDNHWQVVRRSYKDGQPKKNKAAAIAWLAEDDDRVAALMRAAGEIYASLAADVLKQPGGSALNERQFGKALAAALGKHPLVALIHLKRRGLLDLPAARAALKTPQNVQDLFEMLN